MKNIFKIIKISKPMYGLFALSMFLIVLGAALDMVTPFFNKLIVDQIVTKISGQGGDVNHLATLIALSFGVSFIGLVFTGFSNRLGDHIAGRVRRFLTERFYYKILSLPQSYYDSEISGKILNQLNRGILIIQTFMNTMSNFFLPTLLQSVFTVVFMAYYSIPVAFFTAILFPIYLYLSHLSTKEWGKEEGKKNAIEDTTRGRINEVIANIKLVKSFITEHIEYKTVSENMRESNKIYARQSTTFHIYDFLRNLSLIIVFTIVMIIVFYNTYSGKLSVGEMVLLLQLLNQAQRPLFAMSFILTRVQEAENGSKEFFQILELPSTEDFDRTISYKKLEKTNIVFDKVSFKYETSDMVLKDISFDIQEREKVALVGHSGVGKSTIVSLILKFYNPTEGTILLNGTSYAEHDHRFIRNNISLVFQENELFSTTIKENVAYGSPDATEKDVIKALKLANAWDFVSKFKDGLESLVGERGVRLSGGQKQRIQIARAILKNSPILILDEATSSLDSKSEMEVQKGLDNLMKNRLTIIIAHRFSTIQNVDKIIVVDEGTIVDMGSPRELSQRPGVYKDLLQYQVSGNKKLLASFEIY
ncbi:ABC transporter ATP-binding protein [Candidatus Microgenomates bacterium]|nr:ABC transporter ATP-binding protein [Candidatus Microgenomates bacterium]